MIRMYQMRLADLEYREGLGSVSAVPLRRSLLILRRSKHVAVFLNNTRNDRQSRGQHQDHSKLFLDPEEYINHNSADNRCYDIQDTGHV